MTHFIEMSNITKVYPNGVTANQDINLTLEYGEIHALMGENGAGKSTLMKILFGMEQQTSGEILLNGQPLTLKTPIDAIKNGIGMVHQHFMLDEELTVTENIILGMEPTRGLSLDFKKAEEMVTSIAKQYNFNVKPRAKVSDLNVSQKQKVEILKALIRGAKLIILDEPTAVLTPQETQELFVQLFKLRDDGHTIIFISHKLKEVKAICSRATVMRAGKSIGSYDLADTTLEELSRMMVGRDVVREVEKKPAHPQEVVLAVDNLGVIDEERNTVVDGVSFVVKAGEILGIAGVEGNGQRELIDCVTGLHTDYSGSVYINGVECPPDNGVRKRRDLGLKHIPEDRFTYGVMAEGSIEDNLISNVYGTEAFSRKGLLNNSHIKQFSTQLVKDFQVKTDSEQTPVRMLSGGNVQKVVAAREMSEDAKILVADQPTRGIDVGTAAFIHDRLIEMRDKGTAILLVSADLNEVLTLSDSLIVFYEGTISAYFKDASTVSEEELGLYMLGMKKMTEEEMSEVRG